MAAKERWSWNELSSYTQWSRLSGMPKRFRGLNCERGFIHWIIPTSTSAFGLAPVPVVLAHERVNQASSWGECVDYSWVLFQLLLGYRYREVKWQRRRFGRRTLVGILYSKIPRYLPEDWDCGKEQNYRISVFLLLLSRPEMGSNIIASQSMCTISSTRTRRLWNNA